MVGSREECSGTFLRLSIVLANDQFGCCDKFAGIQEKASVVSHGRTRGARGINPTSSAFTQSHGVPEL